MLDIPKNTCVNQSILHILAEISLEIVSSGLNSIERSDEREQKVAIIWRPFYLEILTHADQFPLYARDFFIFKTSTTTTIDCSGIISKQGILIESGL